MVYNIRKLRKVPVSGYLLVHYCLTERWHYLAVITGSLFISIIPGWRITVAKDCITILLSPLRHIELQDIGVIYVYIFTQRIFLYKYTLIVLSAYIFSTTGIFPFHTLNFNSLSLSYELLLRSIVSLCS